MKKRIFLVILLLSCLINSGCYSRLEINDVLIPMGWGIDIKGDTKLFSAQLAVPQQSETGGGTAPKPLVISDSGTCCWAELARKSSLYLPKTPLWAMTGTLLIGENLARKDTGLFIDFVARNRFNRPNTLLFVTKRTTPEEVMKVKVPGEDFSVLALEKMLSLQQNQIGIYPELHARSFMVKSATPGVEPILPQVIIEKNNGEERLKLEGLAVFLGRKMVGSLSSTESRGFRLLSPEIIRGGLFTVNTPGSTAKTKPSNKITLELINSKAKTTPIFKGDKITMQIEIKAEGNLYEQNNTVDLSKPTMIRSLEIEANKKIKSDVTACIEKAQSFNSDIFGWGLSIKRKNPRLWEEIETDWPQIFSRIETDIKVDYKLRRTYLLEEPFKFVLRDNTHYYYPV